MALVDVAALEFTENDDVGAGLFVQQRCVVGHRVGLADGEGQGFVVDGDVLQRVLGCVAAFGDDSHNGLADITHFSPRQGPDRRGVIVLHLRGRNSRLEIALEVCRVENRHHTRHRERLTDIDAANARMRRVAAPDRDMEACPAA